MNSKRVSYLSDKFLKKTSYLGVGAGKIAQMLGEDIDDVKEAKKLAKARLLNLSENVISLHDDSDGIENVLIVGDLHTPFDMDGYLDFLIEQSNRYNITKVVFIGDIIDNHYSSYHETSTRSRGADDELNAAIERLQRYVDAFPNAIITVGNHDRLILRKAQTGGVSSRWIRSYNEVIGAPGWRFVDHYTLGDNYFVHGEGMMAHTRANMLGMNVIQGHNHSKFQIIYTNHYAKRFGMFVGCGVDHNSFAMDYARTGPPMAKGCGVILDAINKPTPILIPYYE